MKTTLHILTTIALTITAATAATTTQPNAATTAEATPRPANKETPMTEKDPATTAASQPPVVNGSTLILPGIMRLEWEKGMECPWAGSLYAALKYMSEDYTYEQIMGMSGAAYRVCFVTGWDWSCTDALVSFDYATPLYAAIGRKLVWGNWSDDEMREAERQAIMRDLRDGKPVIAINLRVAPEFGVITGYLDNGKEFLCRTYFDKSVFDEWERGEEPKPGVKEKTFAERGGYLANDANFWPFIIMHFGDRTAKPAPRDVLATSLATLAKSFDAGPRDNYYNGRQAYEQWMKALTVDADFDIAADRDKAIKRLGVNDNMLFNLIDARRAAEQYLRESLPLAPVAQQPALTKIADNYATMRRELSAFREKQKFCPDTGEVYNQFGAIGVVTPELRKEQIDLLRRVLALEEENAKLAKDLATTN